MAHGLRGRLALLGTGLLLCIGCMNDEPKPISKPLGKGSTATPLGSNTKQPTTYGGGVQPAGGFTNTGRPDPKTDYFKTAGAAVPTTPGVKTAGGSTMSPPMGSFAPIPGEPYAGARPMTPTTPPGGFEVQPPFQPGSPGSFPTAPTPPTGSFAPMQR